VGGVIHFRVLPEYGAGTDALQHPYHPEMEYRSGKDRTI